MISVLQQRMETLAGEVSEIKIWLREDAKWKNHVEQLVMEYFGRNIQEELKVSNISSVDAIEPVLRSSPKISNGFDTKPQKRKLRSRVATTDLKVDKEIEVKVSSNIDEIESVCSTTISNELYSSPNKRKRKRRRKSSGEGEHSLVVHEDETDKSGHMDNFINADFYDDHRESDGEKICVLDSQSVSDFSMDVDINKYDDTIASVVGKRARKSKSSNCPGSEIADNICRICTKSFKRPSELTQHFKISHPSEKAFQCLTCLRTFGLRNHWTVHMKTHSSTNEAKIEKQQTSKKEEESSTPLDEELHQCVVCNQIFANSELLFNHFEVHSADDGQSERSDSIDSSTLTDFSTDHDPFATKNGDNSYGENSSEPMSEAILRTLKCPNCDTSFSNKKLLMKHVIHQHGWKKKYKCKFCDKSYFTSRILGCHIESRHSRSNH